MPTERAASGDRPDRQNDASLLILISLASGEKHGYALLQDIERFAAVRLGPGTLYGAIARLEQRGLIEPAAAAGRARPYRVTHEGRELLAREMASLRVLVDEGTSRLGLQPKLAGGLT